MTALDDFRARKDAFFATAEESPLTAAQRGSFTGLSYYPEDPALVFTVPLQPGEDVTPFAVPTSTGEQRTYRRAGRVALEIAGQRVALTLLQGPDEAGLFLPFRDATGGDETYPAGRYLDLAPPATGW